MKMMKSLAKSNIVGFIQFVISIVVSYYTIAFGGGFVLGFTLAITNNVDKLETMNPATIGAVVIVATLIVGCKVYKVTRAKIKAW